MAILPKPAVVPAKDDVGEFIDRAPDGRKQIKRIGRKSVITVSIDPVVLARVDEWAKSRGISRAAAISVAIARLK